MRIIAIVIFTITLGASAWMEAGLCIEAPQSGLDVHGDNVLTTADLEACESKLNT